jgi:linoleoyl-CoA desaturase
MTQPNAAPADLDDRSPRTEALSQRLTFGGSGSFHAELRRRVEEFFRRSGRRQRDCWQMYLKSAILLAFFAASYALLVFVAATWWQALPLAILLGLATAGIGFNIQHDGKHQAYSDHRWINNATALTMDLIGGSSYIWHWKHNIFHHSARRQSSCLFRSPMYQQRNGA